MLQPRTNDIFIDGAGRVRIVVPSPGIFGGCEWFSARFQLFAQVVTAVTRTELTQSTGMHTTTHIGQRPTNRQKFIFANEP